MKKLLITSIALISSFIVYAQDTATLQVKVLNEFEKPIVGEQIILESKDKTYTTKGVSNDKGIFFASLLGGKTYNIKVKTIGEAKDYNTIKIPSLEKGKSYAKSVLTIKIFESKSFTLNNVYFDSGKSTLKSESFKELEELLAFLKLKPAIRIEIDGHTDNVGEEEKNI